MALEIGDGESPAFAPGSIVKIRLKDFLTYSYVEMDCGPRFNFVLGPNGSGKSSLVCAICLGLGGKPELLYRAQKLSGFVRHGASKALLEIELQGGPQTNDENVVIRRIIYADNERSDWRLNGHKVQQAQIKEVIDAFRIQLENLCNFLPQEKVHSFAQLQPKELLVETMRAVGGSEMVMQYQNLVEMKDSEMTITKRCNEEQTEIDLLERRNASIEAEVQRYLEREQILERIGIMEKKRPWLVYSAARDEFVRVKQLRRDAIQELEELKQLQSPLKEEYEAVLEQTDETRQIRDELAEKSRKCEIDIKKINTNIDKAAAETDEAYREIQEIQERARTKKLRLESLREELEKVELELRDRPVIDVQPIQQRALEIGRQLREINMEKIKLENETADSRDEYTTLQDRYRVVDAQLKNMEDLKEQRVESLKRGANDTYRALMWLRDNQNRFRRPILEPILLHINLRDRAFADAVETLIPWNVMTTFVAQTPEDYTTFTDECIDRLKLRINAVQLSHLTINDFRSPKSSEEIQQMGFDGWAIDLIDAPEPIMVALADQCRLHSTPIAKKPIDESNLERFGINSCIAGEMRYNIKRSRYGGGYSTMRAVKIRKAFNLTNNVDMDRKRDIEQEREELLSKGRVLKSDLLKVDTIIDDLTRQEDALNQEKVTIQAQKREIQGRLAQYQRLESKRDTLQTRVSAAERELEDNPENSIHLIAKWQKCCLSRAKLVLKYEGSFKSLMETTRRRLNVQLLLARLQKKANQLQQDIQDQNVGLREAERRYSDLNDEFEYRKKRAKDLLEQARREGDPDADLQAKFEQFPEDLGELDLLLASERAKAELNIDTDPAVVQQYETRRQKLDQLRGSLAVHKAELNEIAEKFDAVKKPWEHRLDKLIVGLRERFSASFERLGCAGDIRLDKEDHPKDYSLQLLVQFHSDTPMQPLSSHRQSGGEKSVSIMIYVMALQGVVQMPFRLVDEMNQGMDQRNERLIHALVVETVCGTQGRIVNRTLPGNDSANQEVKEDSGGQYFLITPKLLPDLMYHESMRILTVFNGEWLPDGNQWEASKGCDWYKVA